jgi:hypothetical protein
MSIRVLVLGVVVLGAVGQMGCSTQADASQLTSTDKVSDPATSPPEEGGQFCGGFAAIQCPEGQACVDDPNDDCDPTQGGADCGGICVSGDADGRKKPKCHRPGAKLDYISRDPEQCLTILFVCPDNAAPFFNDCGCGCQRVENTCNYQDPNRRYVSTDPDQCATLRFYCEPNEVGFSDACGCGCQKAVP